MNIISNQYLRIFKQQRMVTNLLSSLERAYCFKSAYSLDKLYPTSNLKVFTPTFTPQSTEKFSGYIPINEIDITYSTSSAPGGQNVNRVNTKVDVRFNVKKASWITEETKEKLLEQFKTKINKEGYLIVRSEVTRSQQLNLADALEKLRNLIRKAESTGVVPVSEETAEMLRKRQLKASRERLLVKKMRSNVKQDRRPVKPDF